MPKFHPSVLIQDCWSSIGDITFYHRNGQCFYKRKPRPTFRGTPAQLGNEHVPVPQPFPEFPSAALEVLEIIPGAETATIRCRLTLADTVHPERWHLSARIQLTAPSVGCNPGKMRSCMAMRINCNEIELRVPNPGFEDCQAHIRYRLIDEVTGYRNNWKKEILPK